MESEKIINIKLGARAKVQYMNYPELRQYSEPTRSRWVIKISLIIDTLIMYKLKPPLIFNKLLMNFNNYRLVI
jgi:hypothetical protein